MKIMPRSVVSDREPKSVDYGARQIKNKVLSPPIVSPRSNIFETNINEQLNEIIS